MQHIWAKSLFLLFFTTSLFATEDVMILEQSEDHKSEQEMMCDSINNEQRLKNIHLDFKSYNYLQNQDKVSIPVIKQGFFCRFEDKLQIKYKIPINFGVE